MNRKHWTKRIGIAALILGLAAIGTSLLSAKPPPPKHKPHPKVHTKHHNAVRHGLPPKLRRVPPRRRVVVRRVGGAVVVRQGETVIHRRPALVIKSAEVLHAVPVKQFSKTDTATYKVVRVTKDCSVVLMQDGKEKTVRLLGVNPIAESDKDGYRYVRNLLIGEFVYLDHDPSLAQEDENGTAVAYLYRAPEGMFLNLEIVRQGYGLMPDYYSFQHDKLFSFYQQKAQADAKGIWASVPVKPITEQARADATEVK